MAGNPASPSRHRDARELSFAFASPNFVERGESSYSVGSDDGAFFLRAAGEPADAGEISSQGSSARSRHRRDDRPQGPSAASDQKKVARMPSAPSFSAPLQNCAGSCSARHPKDEQSIRDHAVMRPPVASRGRPGHCGGGWLQSRAICAFSGKLQASSGRIGSSFPRPQVVARRTWTGEAVNNHYTITRPHGRRAQRDVLIVVAATLQPFPPAMGPWPSGLM